MHQFDEVTPVEDFDFGSIDQEWTHCVKQCCSRGLRYRLRFPRQATVEQKTLLIYAVMMLDVQYFERKCIGPFFWF